MCLRYFLQKITTREGGAPCDHLEQFSNLISDPKNPGQLFPHARFLSREKCAYRNFSLELSPCSNSSIQRCQLVFRQVALVIRHLLSIAYSSFGEATLYYCHTKGLHLSTKYVTRRMDSRAARNPPRHVRHVSRPILHMAEET